MYEGKGLRESGRKARKLLLLIIINYYTVEIMLSFSVCVIQYRLRSGNNASIVIISHYIILLFDYILWLQ